MRALFENNIYSCGEVLESAPPASMELTQKFPRRISHLAGFPHGKCVSRTSRHAGCEKIYGGAKIVIELIHFPG